MARDIVDKLVRVLGRDKVYNDPAIVSLYSKEASGLEASERPRAVVFAESVSDVSALLRLAYRYEFKVFPQGSSTSLSGSAIPLGDGVILSLERMRSLKEISLLDSIAVAEPGLRIDELNLALARHGYMFPVDPASSSVATIGGAINTGAGGMRGAKYGTMRDWVLMLQIVLPDEEGTVMRIGCRTVKCRQGYDLVRLIVGSEGTLAVVTEATLRITSLPEASPTVLAFFEDLGDLVEAVREIKKNAWQPLIMEFLDAETVKIAREFIQTSIEAKGHMLLVAMDTTRESKNRVTKQLIDLMERNNAERVYTAESLEEAEKKQLLALRRSLFPAQVWYAKKQLGIDKKIHVLIEDIAVPPSKLPEAVKELRQIENRYGFKTLLGGHIGDGNIHPAIGYNPDDPKQTRKVEEWVQDVMKTAIKLGGTISAEHGIGTLKKQGLRMELEALGALKALEIMKTIKQAFDPKNILNPGKVI